MPAYAKCDTKFSFFVQEDESFQEIAEELMQLLLSHPKVDKVTFHAHVGFEYVSYLEAEDTYEQQDD